MRRVYIIINGILIFLGYLAVVNTDFGSPNAFYSMFLPLIDIVYFIYLLLLMFIEIYNRTWR